MASKWKLSSLFGALEGSFGVDPDADGSDYKFLPTLADMTFTPMADVIEREAQVHDFARQPHVIGGKKGTLSFKVYMVGSGTPAGDAVAAIAGVPDILLQALLGSVTRGTGDLIEAGSTTTVINVGDGTRYTKGMMVRVGQASRYETRFIASIATNALTLNRALTSAGQTGTTIFASNLYKRANSGHVSLSFCAKRDGIEYTFTGCKLSVGKITGIGARGLAVLELQADVADWTVTTKASLPTSVPTGITAVAPPAIKGAKFAVAGTEEHIYALEFDLGSEFMFQESTAGAGLAGGDGSIQGFTMTDSKPAGMFKSYFASAHLTDFLAGTELALDFACGGPMETNNIANGWGIYVPRAQYMNPQFEEQAGVVGQSLPFMVNDNGSDAPFFLSVF